MMENMTDWQDKDDLDLTAGDIDAMFDVAIPVDILVPDIAGLVITGCASSISSASLTPLESPAFLAVVADQARLQRQLSLTTR